MVPWRRAKLCRCFVVVPVVALLKAHMSVADRLPRYSELNQADMMGLKWRIAQKRLSKDCDHSQRVNLLVMEVSAACCFSE